ncbi:MAG: hypothetical protein FWE22_00815 [Firmicutes bacterium]|nr:hypothetical protein [Bacillota bacterium]
MIDIKKIKKWLMRIQLQELQINSKREQVSKNKKFKEQFEIISIDFDDEEMQLIQEINDFILIRKEVKDAILKIIDVKGKVVLEHHYLLGKTLWQIAQEFGENLRNIERIHKKALAELGQIIEENSNEDEKTN